MKKTIVYGGSFNAWRKYLYRSRDQDLWVGQRWGLGYLRLRIYCLRIHFFLFNMVLSTSCFALVPCQAFNNNIELVMPMFVTAHLDRWLYFFQTMTNILLDKNLIAFRTNWSLQDIKWRELKILQNFQVQWTEYKTQTISFRFNSLTMINGLNWFYNLE